MASRNMEAFQNYLADTKIKDRSFADRASGEFEAAMTEIFASDLEVHEPPCFPHGGIHKGRERWFAVRKEMLDRRMRTSWEQTIEVLHTWDVPDDDVIVMNYMMTWTDTRTGRTIRQPAVEVMTFRNAQIVKTQLFPQDTSALMETLS